MNTHPATSPSDPIAGRRFCKAKVLAERLGVSPRTIFRWADAGKITRHKINARVVLFCEEEVAAFVGSARVDRYDELESYRVLPAPSYTSGPWTD